MVEGRHLEKRLSDATFGLHVSKVFDAANDSQNRPQWYCHDSPSNGNWAHSYLETSKHRRLASPYGFPQKVCSSTAQLAKFHRPFFLQMSSDTNSGNSIYPFIPSGKMKLVGQAAQIECIEDSVGTLVGASPIRTGETIAQDLV